MAQTNAPSHKGPEPDTPRRLPLWGGILLVLQFAAMMTCVVVLGAAINWPASLGETPEVLLPKIHSHASEVFLGYLMYLCHAILLIPVSVIASRVLRMSDVSRSIIVVVGALASICKVIGIARWLLVMPVLAQRFADPPTNDASREAIKIVYLALNEYAGGIGELLGVGLFSGSLTVLISFAVAKSGRGRLVGYFGYLAASLLFATLPSIAGIGSPELLTVSGMTWQIWTLALAVWFYRGDKNIEK
ncbi:MAG: DUF4386 domain-containing protein [Fimbriimonadaceae bacterium]|nr:DUF4386 domain-containing protein [Fimbriimonadaceae bacterium]